MDYRDRQRQTGALTDFGEELGVGQSTDGGLLQDEIETSVGNESDSGSSTDFGEELGGSPVDSGGSDNTNSIDIGGGADGDLQAGTDPDAGDNPGGGSSAGTAPLPGSGDVPSPDEPVDNPDEYIDQVQEEEPDPPDIRAMSVGFTSSTLVVGRTETVRVRLRNFGGQTGEAQRAVLANGNPIGTVTASVPPGGTRTKTFDFTVPQSDRITLSFQDDYYDTTSSKNVEPRPTEGTLSPNIEAPNGAMVGETFPVDVTVEAVGGNVDDMESLNVKVGGRTVLTDSVGPLSGGDGYSRSINVTAQQEGGTSVVLNVGQRKTSDRIQIEAEPEAEFSVASFDVNTNARPGQTSEVRVALRNNGDGAGSITVPILVDGVQVSSVGFSNVRPGGSASSRATYTTPDSDSYTLELGEFGLSTNVSPPESQQPAPPQVPQTPQRDEQNQRDTGQLEEIVGSFSDRQLAIGAGVAAGAVVLIQL